MWGAEFDGGFLMARHPDKALSPVRIVASFVAGFVPSSCIAPDASLNPTVTVTGPLTAAPSVGDRITGASSDSSWASAKVVKKNAPAISNPARPEASRLYGFISIKPRRLSVYPNNITTTGI